MLLLYWITVSPSLLEFKDQSRVILLHYRNFGSKLASGLLVTYFVTSKGTLPISAKDENLAFR